MTNKTEKKAPVFKGNVDFDGLRLSLLESYNDLANFLNQNTKQMVNGELFISIEQHNIHKWMGELRNDIVVVAALSDPQTGKHIAAEKVPKIVELLDEDLLCLQCEEVQLGLKEAKAHACICKGCRSQRKTR